MTNTNIEFGEALTWDEIAKIYQENYGITYPPTPYTFLDMVAKLPFIYKHPDGTLHIIEKQTERE